MEAEVYINVDIETLRHTYETNVFGVFAVTKTMLPLLKKSTAGQIVNLSSGLKLKRRASEGERRASEGERRASEGERRASEGER